MSRGGAEGIAFDTLNSGGWLSVATNAFGPMPNLAPSSIALQTTSGGGIGLWDGDAGGGITLMAGPIGALTFGAGGIQLLSPGGGGITVFAASPISIDSDANITVTAQQSATVTAENDLSLKPSNAGAGAGNLFIQNLPNADPGISGAVWNSAGTLKISP